MQAHSGEKCAGVSDTSTCMQHMCMMHDCKVKSEMKGGWRNAQSVEDTRREL